MEEVDLRYKEWNQNESPHKYSGLREWATVPNLDMEETLKDIVDRVNSGDNVYIKFADDHSKRPGAIALIKKVTGVEFTSRSYEGRAGRFDDALVTYYEDKRSDYTFHLRWEDRKNTTKVRMWNPYHDSGVVYLPDYEGPTVWSMFDAKEFAKENAIVPKDRMGKELAVNDTVVYINARYGSGACLDFGVIREIKNKADRSSTSVTTEVIIETIALTEGERIEKSTIKRSETSIMRMTDVDLMDEAFVRKLTVTQKT